MATKNWKEYIDDKTKGRVSHSPKKACNGTLKMAGNSSTNKVTVNKELKT